MQRRIQPLSQQLANQIAAGEVVERPASVVKELLENSIDAGAGSIELELERGGSKRIRLRDDGAGIHRDDLVLAVSPHATSKIYSQRELEQIASLGFRGEALASISSVCRFTLCSHQREAEEAWQISNDGMGRLSAPAPGVLPVGTSVEVRDLFYNTPARRKFLRSERTEFLHVEEVLKRVALSRFDVAFSLVHNGKQNLRLRAAQDDNQRQKRVADVLGKRFVQYAMTLEQEAAGMRLWGWLATPEYSRSQADSQYFYLNGRVIRDKLISHAVRQAHQEVLEPGRYPAYLLYLEVDPQQVDINVHPTKHEVRFRESRLVHDFVFRTLLNALNEPSQTSPVHAPLSVKEGPGQANGVASYRIEKAVGAKRQPARVAEQMRFYRQATTTSAGEMRHGGSQKRPLGKALALLYGRYLLAENAQGPLLVDLDLAREYLLSERLGAMLADGEVQSQPLLIPITLRLGEEEIGGLESWLGELLRLGFVVERLGAESLVLRQVPVLIRGADAELILSRLIAVMLAGEQGRADSPALIAAMVKGVVDTGTLERLDDAEGVLRELEALGDNGNAFWQPLAKAQLRQWMGSRG